MTIYSEWPSILLMLICIFFLWPQKIWYFLDEKTQVTSSRFPTIDGLRGFLALAVVLHHCIISHIYHQTGIWTLPPSSYYSILGQAGVAIFFMITSFLFWGKILDEKKEIQWMEFYLGRFFRIAPLYWVSIFLMLFLVFTETEWKLNFSLQEILNQIFTWLIPGLIKSPLTINGYKDTNILTAGVTWTLYYEWIFYLLLPIVSILSIKKTNFGFLPISILLILLIPYGNEMYFVAMFTAGMFSAAIVRRFPELNGDNWLKSTLALALISTTLLRRETAYEWISVFSLGAFFLLISTGTSLFGLLKTKSAKRLGSISYGIYILQGPVIKVISSSYLLGNFSQKNSANYWVSASLIILSIILLASITYYFIEKPGINLGKKFIIRYSSSSK